MRMVRILLSSAFAFTATTTAIPIRGIDGNSMSPFRPAGKANVLFFISSDCPVSNSYAPEIQRLCSAFSSKGVGCSLYYEDVGIQPAAVRTHLQEYRYAGIF